MFNPAGMSQSLHDMVPGPAGTAVPRVIYKSEDGILDCYGTTFPPDASVGYAPSCIFRRINATTLDIALYINIGTKASSNFDPAIMAS